MNMWSVSSIKHFNTNHFISFITRFKRCFSNFYKHALIGYFVFINISTFVNLTNFGLCEAVYLNAKKFKAYFGVKLFTLNKL